VTSDGGTLDPASGLSNASGYFVTNFSSAQPGMFTVQAQAERQMENLQDTQLIDIQVLPEPPRAKATGFSNIFNLIVSIPQTIMSVLKVSMVPDTQTAGSVSVVNIPQGSSNEAQEGSMQVVVLPDRDELRMETIQDSGKIVPDIPSALPEPQVVIIQEHMIAGSIESPRETTSPEPRAIIPENYIGSKPQILPIKFTCPAGYVTCNGQCVDLMTDTAYCGSCNSTCPSQFTCVAGVCTSQCNSGQTLCNGACASLLTDSNNCGSCGNVCTNGAACESGQCVLPMVKIQTTRPGDIGKVRF
jgi:hypothetical protein